MHEIRETEWLYLRHRIDKMLWLIEEIRDKDLLQSPRFRQLMNDDIRARASFEEVYDVHVELQEPVGQMYSIDVYQAAR